MGWTGFYPRQGWSERSEMEHLHEPHKLLKLQKVGTVWFSAFELASEPGTIIIGVILTQRNKGEFMYKTMDELMGPAPHYCRCPNSILKLATEPKNEHAALFRERCRFWNSRPKLEPGVTYKLEEPVFFGGTPVDTVIPVQIPRRRNIFRTPQYEGLIRLRAEHLLNATPIR